VPDAVPALGPGATGPVFIAGPCVLESRDTVFEIASFLSSLGVPVVFKGSFDKANRSSVDAPRGPGLDAGLALLAEVRARYGLPVLTDVHAVDQCAAVGEVVDVVQIPAFLCRQTDLVVAAARTGRIVNLKRGQFLDPRRMRYVVDKVRAVGGRAWVTERGSTFGHGDLVLDPRALVWLRETGVPVVYDCTHTVQRPGGEGPTTGGARDLAHPLARAAAAIGVDAFFAEVHPEPARALSDAETQLDFDQLRRLVHEVVAIDAVRRRLAPAS